MRKLLNMSLHNLVRRRDARRGFTTKTDAERFYSLITHGDASLFDVIERTPQRPQPEAVGQTIKAEADSLAALMPKSAA